MGAKNEKIFSLDNNGKLDLDQSNKSINNKNERKLNVNLSINSKNINNYKMINLKQSIKSKYILIQIFHILKEKRLFKIIEYNKE